MKNYKYSFLLAFTFLLSVSVGGFPAYANAQEPAAASATADPENTNDTNSHSVTPFDGTATVRENSVKTPEEREFFTIQTEEGNVFYLVVDKQKQSNNVYLLSTATEADLIRLAENSKQEVSSLFAPDTSVRETPQEVMETPKAEEKSGEAEKQKSGGNLLFITLVAMAAGAAGYYIKVVKPKKDLDAAEDLDELLENEETYVNEDDAEEQKQPSQTAHFWNETGVEEMEVFFEDEEEMEEE